MIKRGLIFVAFVAGCSNPPMPPMPGSPAKEMPLIETMLLQVTLHSEPMPTPTPVGICFHFVYTMSLTNGFVMSSTDLVHWVRREDYQILSNGDWYLPFNPLDPLKPWEFFVGGGEPIQTQTNFTTQP